MRYPTLVLASEDGLGLPNALNGDPKRLLMTKARNVDWAEPVLVGEAMKLTLENRNLRVGRKQGELVVVNLHALPAFHGPPRYDNIKLSVETDDGDSRLYYAKCLAFFKDAKNMYYVGLQWYTEVAANHPHALLPQLLLAPANLAASYDVQPVSSIVNGALLVQCGVHYWAIQSPREYDRYLAYNNT